MQETKAIKVIFNTIEPYITYSLSQYNTHLYNRIKKQLFLSIRKLSLVYIALYKTHGIDSVKYSDINKYVNKNNISTFYRFASNMFTKQKNIQTAFNQYVCALSMAFVITLSTLIQYTINKIPSKAFLKSIIVSYMDDTKKHVRDIYNELILNVNIPKNLKYVLFGIILAKRIWLKYISDAFGADANKTIEDLTTKVISKPGSNLSKRFIFVVLHL